MTYFLENYSRYFAIANRCNSGIFVLLKVVPDSHIKNNILIQHDFYGESWFLDACKFIIFPSRLVVSRIRDVVGY